MAKRATVEKRPRRERGSLNPDDILEGAFELAAEVGLDNLSMPMLGKHLDVGVTSIYWYFRKKDDLLNAMTDRALGQLVDDISAPPPFIEAGNWRETLTEHAWTMRRAFLASPILCDLILIRSSLSAEAAQVGATQTEGVIASLMEAGLSLGDAVDTYSAVQLHVRGSVVLQRLHDKNQESGEGPSAYYENLTISTETTPLLARARAQGHQSGAPDDRNFQFGLDCVLDNASRLIETGSKSKAGKAAPAKAPAKRAAAKRVPAAAAPVKAAAKKVAAKKTAGAKTVAKKTTTRARTVAAD
ncbi:TetR/AcrR family transcriptional regulator [Nocardia sp. NPDC057668]|uniref:TetR/AcrR family transcriptional regulator n=1 Tax=Nocardia sp. NPDC057668 TaxID=3346202 RepID=UPI00366E32A1